MVACSGKKFFFEFILQTSKFAHFNFQRSCFSKPFLKALHTCVQSITLSVSSVCKCIFFSTVQCVIPALYQCYYYKCLVNINKQKSKGATYYIHMSMYWKMKSIVVQYTKTIDSRLDYVEHLGNKHFGTYRVSKICLKYL